MKRDDSVSLPDGEMACPDCGKRFHVDVVAILPRQTDITLSIDITPGQLCMAKTVAGVMESFADLQVAVGEQIGCDVGVFIAGLSYENDRIDITYRITNSPRPEKPEQLDLAIEDQG